MADGGWGTVERDEEGGREPQQCNITKLGVKTDQACEIQGDLCWKVENSRKHDSVRAPFNISYVFLICVIDIRAQNQLDRACSTHLNDLGFQYQGRI